MKQNAKHYSELAKHTGVIEVKIHVNVSYVANRFSRSYNKKLHNEVIFCNKNIFLNLLYLNM